MSSLDETYFFFGNYDSGLGLYNILTDTYMDLKTSTGSQPLRTPNAYWLNTTTIVIGMGDAGSGIWLYDIPTSSLTRINAGSNSQYFCKIDDNSFLMGRAGGSTVVLYELDTSTLTTVFDGNGSSN